MAKGLSVVPDVRAYYKGYEVDPRVSEDEGLFEAAYSLWMIVKGKRSGEPVERTIPGRFGTFESALEDANRAGRAMVDRLTQ